MTMVPLSLLDLAVVGPGESVRDSLQGSVRLAQRAEQLGYRRVWYAEHHNMSAIASSATAVLIAHVAANTERIRLGSGGVMLPNHSPLVIAEQFGTIALPSCPACASTCLGGECWKKSRHASDVNR